MLKLGIGCLIALVVAFGIALLFGLGGMAIYNGMVSRSQAADKQWAQVENVYQRRYDLIPNLVNTVQGAANFEKSTLTEITNARASVGQVKLGPQDLADPEKLKQFERAQGSLSSALSRLLVVAERYPELKATTNFRDLQVQLEGSENRIAVERARFNDAVQDYNTYIRSMPNSFIANFAGFQPRPFFTAVPGANQVPAVKFDFNNAPAPAPVPAR